MNDELATKQRRYTEAQRELRLAQIKFHEVSADFYENALDVMLGVKDAVARTAHLRTKRQSAQRVLQQAWQEFRQADEALSDKERKEDGNEYKRWWEAESGYRADN